MDILNTAEITEAVRQLLEDAPNVGNDGVDVTRSEPEPEDPPPNGWIGVFRVGVQYPTRVAGAGNAGRGHRVELMLMLVQTGESGADCEDRIELLSKNTLDVLLEEGSFGGKVTTIEDVSVRYSDYQKTAESKFRQTAFIFITGFKSI